MSEASYVIGKAPSELSVGGINSRNLGRLQYFDYFRGVTILFVVAGHCYNNWRPAGFLEVSVANFITGATAIFVFISGFFFHFAFYKRFNYRNFMYAKFRNVALPYLVLTTVSAAGFIFAYGEIPFPIVFSEDQFLNNAISYVANVFTGRSWTAYWYVPFIMLVFAMSPLFIWFISLRLSIKLALTAFCLLMALFVHRPTLNLNPAHSVLYLMGFYMIGILFSEYRISLEEFLKSTTIFWCVIAVVCAALTAYLGQIGNSHKMTPWAWQGIDLMVPLKLVSIPAMLGLFLNIERFSIPVLRFFC
ncbi:acyltransferase [Yangia mangrovi]|uniref:Acyltransferase n=1 Tax=Alloyangia mangrovi TaxID=1779329 RepID=A0ABT2KSB5_9RHOB|nr:acyltransferase [Alloyangia mangrovi]MCT4372267.1 acyltransferase [Alloyangia mangrovi]